MALVSISTDFRRPTRVLVALVLVIFIVLYFPGSSPIETLPPAIWELSFGKPVPVTFEVDPLEHINPLIGTLNGGETTHMQRRLFPK